jgi:uncharacterized metal-binding protein
MSEKENQVGGVTNEACCSGQTKTVVVACSGGSNVGQISNQLMIELGKSGFGNAYCLAGIGAALSGFVETAKAARTILIDGCPTGCGKKVFENHSIEPTRYIVVTQLGIEKTHNFDTVPAETKEVLAKLLGAM